MSISFWFLPAFNLTVLLFLSLLIINNSVMGKIQNRNFLKATLLIAVITILEVITFLLDGAPVKFRFLHILANYLGFGFTPLIAVLLSSALSPEKNHKYAYYLWILYFIWVSISLFKGPGVFKVFEDNSYHRDSGFYVYVAFYVASLIYFFMNTFLTSMKYQSKNNYILHLNIVFVMAGTTIQTMNPEIHSTWVCVTLATLMYYIYYNELLYQVDTQTQMLNYNCFKRTLTISQKNCVLVVIELDNFKKIQQNFNRDKANEVLVSISEQIFSYYRKYGKCYRIGTDEFAVIIPNSKLDFDKINRDFFIQVIRNSNEIDDLPLVSLGYSQFNKSDSISDALTIADIKKHAFTKERLNYIYM